MKNLYGVVIKFSDGGERMNNFLKKDSAINNSKEVIDHIIKNNITGIKVYLSKLEYDSWKNRLLTSELINSESELLFQN